MSNKSLIGTLLIIFLTFTSEKQISSLSIIHKVTFFGRYEYFTKSRECEIVKTIFDFEKDNTCNYARFCSSNPTSDNAIFDKWNAKGKWTLESDSTVIVELNDSSNYNFKILTDTTIQMLNIDSKFSKLILRKQQHLQ